MSRILARVLGGSAGPDPILAGPPPRFEPGLEMAAGPGLTAEEAEAAGPTDLEPSGPAGERAVRVVSPAARLDDLPTDSRPEPPPAGPSWPDGRPEPGPQPPGAPAPGPARRPGRAEPSRPEEAGSPRPSRPRPAYPVRPAPAFPDLAEASAAQPRPPGRTADPAAPVRPADRAPAAAAIRERREPTGQRRRPDPGPAPDGRPGPAAPRRAARQVPGRTEAEPVVHITIGQVEIRADRAAAGGAAPAGRPAARPRRVAPDLSEYLQRRGKQR